MTDTTVAYHVEDGVGRPAINVKDHNGGDAYEFALDRLMPGLASPGVVLRNTDLRSIAYHRIVSDFWQAAQEIATQRGLGEITQEGRSGGWLVFTSPDAVRLESAWSEPRERAEWAAGWLEGYYAMRQWAEAFIADAPRKVAHLAAQYAMDEAGEPAAKRMFAFGRTA